MGTWENALGSFPVDQQRVILEGIASFVNGGYEVSGWAFNPKGLEVVLNHKSPFRDELKIRFQRES